MKWEQLLCKDREYKYAVATDGDIRTEFRKDYHRIVGSASFRRLQDKAQVYPLERGDFVRTRLTHSLEVSSFARSLCDTIFRSSKIDGVNDEIRENCCDILDCAGLVHDIGNPPFGHFGEYAIRQWFAENFPKLTYRGTPVTELLNEQMQADFLKFEGNAQALRVLSRLHCLMSMSTGMNLTYALLNTIIKYPVNSVEIDPDSGDIRTKKMGYFYSERELFKTVTESTGAGDLRFPLTFILEAADDIAYKTADIEDAVIKGLLTYDTLLEELKSGKYLGDDPTDEQCAVLSEAAAQLEHSLSSAIKLGMHEPRKRAVQRWTVKPQNTLLYAAADAFCENYEAIMCGEFKTDLLSASRAAGLANALGKIAYKYAFRSPQVVMSEISEHAVMNVLLDKIVTAALNFKIDDRDPNDRFANDLTDVLSDNYREICRNNCKGKSDAEQAYYRLLFATDCISGMTDGYATEIARKLKGSAF